MKRIIILLFAVIVYAGCNNSGNDADNSKKPGKAAYDSIQTNHDGDTSSYERMPNRVTDSAPQ